MVNNAPQRITVLGATGSVGTSTLDLIAREPDRYSVAAVTAKANAPALAQLARTHRAKLAVVADPAHYAVLKSELSGSGIDAAAGPSGLEAAAAVPADCTVAAIVGVLLYSIGVIPIGLLMVVGIGMVGFIFKSLFKSDKPPSE